MKRTPLIVASLALNIGLVAVILYRPTIVPAAFQAYLPGQARALNVNLRTKPAAAPSAVAMPPERLWARLDAGTDYAAWIVRLRQAGFPPNVIRSVISSLVGAQFEARSRALTDRDPNTPYWVPQAPLFGNSKELEQYYQISRERTKLSRDLFNDPFFATEDATAAQRRQFGPLSRQKIDAVQRIEDDYAEMASQIRSAMNGIALPEDKEKIALLEREKQADLAAILTPDELSEYNVRSSPLTRLLVRQLGGFDATEQEFRAIFDAQQQYGQRLTGGGVSFMANSTDREGIQQQLTDQLKNALGPRYTDYMRETDPTFQQLTRLAQRDNLPRETVLNAYNLRDSVVEASNRIYDDPSLPADQKKAALQTLAQSTRSQLLTLLGPTTGQAYVSFLNSRWLDNVEQGSAVSFTGRPSNSMSTSSNIGMVTVGFGNSPKFRRVSTTTTETKR